MNANYRFYNLLNKHFPLPWDLTWPIKIKGGVPVDSPVAYSPLTSNFCNQKLIIVIGKCEKYHTIKTLVVVKLWSAMRWACDTDVFSISNCIAIGKLPSQISLINNLLSFLLITGYFHIIRSKNFVDSFAYVWNELRYCGSVNSILVHQTIETFPRCKVSQGDSKFFFCSNGFTKMCCFLCDIWAHFL